MRSRPAPFYFIYGEPDREVDPRFAHVERVSDRKALHQGHVRRHSHPHLHQLSLWRNGNGTYYAEDQSHRLHDCVLTWMPAGTVHGFDIAGRCDAIVVSMSTDFLRECIGGVDANALGMILRQPLVAPVGGDLAVRLGQGFEDMEREYDFPSWAQSHMIGAHLRLNLITVARLAQKSGDASGLNNSLLARFLGLLDKRFSEHWTVERYAAALGATPYLLNKATQDGLGMQASHAIRARILQESKRLLIYTMLSVTEIGTSLGFEDPSHFGRIFRRQMGSSPARWRVLHRAMTKTP